jgi:hypothetical protein
MERLMDEKIVVAGKAIARSRALKEVRILSNLKYIALILLCVLTTACLPLPIKTVRGVSGKAKSQDYSFIKEGQTTREEVIDKLGWMDSGIQEKRLFWGRWNYSERVTIFVFPGAVGPYRSYTTCNLLIEFDERGIVSRSQRISEHDLTHELLAWHKQSSGSQAGRPMINSINVARIFDDYRNTFIDATLRMGADSIEIVDTGQGAMVSGPVFRPIGLGPGALIRISINDIHDIWTLPRINSNGNPAYVFLNISYGMGYRIAPNATGYDRIMLQISARDLYTLIKYFESVHAGFGASRRINNTPQRKP